VKTLLLIGIGPGDPDALTLIDDGRDAGQAAQATFTRA